MLKIILFISSISFFTGGIIRSNFFAQALTTLVGTFAGFCFSIILFYLTERWKEKSKNKNLSDNIQFELQFNIDFLNSYKEEFEQMIARITSGQKAITFIFKHSKLQSHFLLGAFQTGVLYKYLTTDELKEMHDMMNYFHQYRDNTLWELLIDYLNNKKTPQEVLASFEWDAEQMEKYLRLFISLKEKLKILK